MDTHIIKTYYDELAKDYDQNRFANSYGQFIDAQERAVLDRFLHNGKTIDLACGTGRFMNYCQTGFDISPEMLKVANQKYPEKRYHCGDIHKLSLAEQFDQAICFHLIMHLERTSLATVLDRVYDLLNKGGLFIFDVPSAERRSLVGSAQQNWHGNNSYQQAQIDELLGTKWKSLAVQGILFFPLHRFPVWMRRWLLPLDRWLNRTWLKRYASYRIHVLQKCGL